MSERARAGFEQLADGVAGLSEAVAHLEDDEISGFVAELQRHANQVASLLRRATERAVERQRPKREGFRSTAAWLAANTGIRRAVAKDRCRQATLLDQLPALKRVADAGLVHDEQVDRILRCYEAAPHSFDAATDEEFAAQAVAETPYALARALDAWRRLHVPPRRPSRSSVSATKHPDGTVRGAYEFVGPDASMFVAATEALIGASLRAKRDGDPSLEQLDVDHLRARAVLDLLDLATRRQLGERPTAPDRYRVCLQVDPAGNPAGHPPEAMCDAAFFRLVMDERGQPLDVGRLRSTWTDAQRRAVAARDGHCRFDGCELPPSWCDVHHIVPWEHGGPTNLANAILLCRHHHVFVHSQQWRHEDGRFVPPAGWTVGLRRVAWPPQAA